MVKMVQGDDVPLHHYAATPRCPRSENLMYKSKLAMYLTCMYVCTPEICWRDGGGWGPAELTLL